MFSLSFNYLEIFQYVQGDKKKAGNHNVIQQYNIFDQFMMAVNLYFIRKEDNSLLWGKNIKSTVTFLKQFTCNLFYTFFSNFIKPFFCFDSTIN